MFGCFKQPKIQDDDEDKEFTKHFQRAQKILLLGTGESGKTTILKQMKILHINGFSIAEKKAKIPFILQNIQESIHDILSNMSRINPPVQLSNNDNQESVEYLLDFKLAEGENYPQEFFDHVKKVWADEGVQETFQRSNEYQLIDSASYFLDKIDEIRSPDYIPSTQDILFCRIKTTSITVTEFSVPLPKIYGGGSANFLMYDVGGQRGQRKKWIQAFDGINAVLFIIAVSDFDQTLREDETQNRLVESFKVFEDIYGSRFLRDAALIVFLNKQDLLKKKIEQGRRIERYFPEYSEFQPKEKISCEYDKARLFFKQKILDSAKSLTENALLFGMQAVQLKLPPRQVFIHETIATDTNNVKKVFDSVEEKLFQDATDMFKLKLN